MNNDAWLWSARGQRESIRLLCRLARDLPVEKRLKLEDVIIAGPPKHPENEDTSNQNEYAIWFRLKIIENEGVQLGKVAKIALDSLSTKHPSFSLSKDGSDEFPFWMTISNYHEEQIESPRSIDELAKWLLIVPTQKNLNRDDWDHCCRSNWELAEAALKKADKAGTVPVFRWRTALQEAARDDLIGQASPMLIKSIENFADAEFTELSGNITHLLSKLVETNKLSAGTLTSIEDRLLRLAIETDDLPKDPVGFAINDPIGQITQTRLSYWFHSKPKDDELLPKDIASIFSRLCDPKNTQFRSGRIILAAHIVTLFRVDQAWVIKYLLPNFSWAKSNDEAFLAWSAYLWSPRYHQPLHELWIDDFLLVSEQLTRLKKYRKQYASIFAVIVLNHSDAFERDQITDVLIKLHTNDLREVLNICIRFLNGNNSERARTWGKSVSPFILNNDIFFRIASEQAITETFAQIALSSGNAFPDAFTQLESYIHPIEYPTFLMHRILKSELAPLFPEITLSLLNRVLNTNSKHASDELLECLNVISTARPALKEDATFRELEAIQQTEF